MNEVTIEIKLKTLNRFRKCLVDAKGNAEELLSEHDRGLERTTKKNRLTAEMYEAEIKECQCLIDWLDDL